MPHEAAQRLVETFAHNLRKLRHGAGWTQEKLAQRIGVTSESLGRLERGTSDPTCDTLLRLALALRVPIDLFFGWRVQRIHWLSPPQVACPSCRCTAKWDEEKQLLICPACDGRWTISLWDGASFFSESDTQRGRYDGA